MYFFDSFFAKKYFITMVVIKDSNLYSAKADPASVDLAKELDRFLKKIKIIKRKLKSERRKTYT